jgi:predicted DNA-binding protein (MmcQ/YjbR family)
MVVTVSIALKEHLVTDHSRLVIDPYVLDRLRSICLILPEAMEAEAFGAPTFQIRTKNFVMTHRAERGPSAWFKAAPGMQDQFIERDPDRYFAPPYLGPKGWIATWLESAPEPDWDDIEELTIASYRLIAPKRLVAQLDGAT